MRQRLMTVVCVASILACVLVPAAAGASVGVGDISTFAGSPVFGPVSATSIGSVGGAAGATIDGTTYAYIADGENVIRRVDLTTGQAQVVAGNGGFAAPTAGAPATSTPTAGPEDVTVDAAGDFAFETSREIVFVPAASGAYFGQAMTAGDIYVLGVTAETIALEPDGSLLYDYDGVIRVDPVSTGASTGMLAEGDIDNLSISADPAHDGNFAFVVGDTGPSKAGHEIDYYAAHAGTYFGLSMSEGIHAIADTANEGGLGVDSGDGGPATNAIVNPGSTGYYSLAFDAAGDLLVLDTGEDGIHDGQQRLIAATSCSSNCVFGLPAMNAGYIYRTELAAKTIAIAGSEDVFADEGFAGNALYSPIGTDEGIVVGDGTYGYDGDGSTGASSELANVSWVASDPVGDVAIVDSADSRVRFMPASSGSFYGQSMTAGHLYTVAGNGILAPESGSSGYGGDEGPATAPAAKFDTFADGSGVALDDSGDLAIADPGNGRVRFVPASSGSFFGKSMLAGDVYTIASGLSYPTDVAYAAGGSLVVADGVDIKEIATGTGAVTTITIAASTSAEGVAVDANGDIAYADGFDSVYLIPATTGTYFGQPLTAGVAGLIAGGTKGYANDGGAATSAALNEPHGLAFDRAGDLVIAQEGEEPFYGDLVDPAVRFLPASSGSFYGQSMTEGDIYTIAGQMSGGFSGDDGPGPAAKLSEPTSVAMVPGEDVLIADELNDRVRIVSGSIPTATTGPAGVASYSEDTVTGSVNPQGRPIGFSFEYGTSTAYGASTTEVAVGDDHAEHAESQSISGLTPSAIYHYRILADYNEAGAVVSVPGADETFTTAAAPSTGNSESTGTTTTASTSTTSTSTSSRGTSVSVATSPKAIEELLNGCSSSALVLNDVYIQGSHVFLSGSAAKSLVGKKVKILFNEGKQVATATVEANGQYTTTAPLPPAKIRDNLNTRYTAEIGKVRSVHLKLVRRLLLEPPKASGTTITLTGQLTLPLTKPIAPVVVEQQLECGKTTIAKTFTPAANGHFHITVTVPANAKAAIFRLTSKVAANKHSVAHGFTTFSLPLPVAIG